MKTGVLHLPVPLGSVGEPRLCPRTSEFLAYYVRFCLPGGGVAHTFNPSIWKAGQVDLRVGVQPGLQSKF